MASDEGFRISYFQSEASCTVSFFDFEAKEAFFAISLTLLTELLFEYFVTTSLFLFSVLFSAVFLMKTSGILVAESGAITSEISAATATLAGSCAKKFILVAFGVFFLTKAVFGRRLEFFCRRRFDCDETAAVRTCKFLQAGFSPTAQHADCEFAINNLLRIFFKFVHQCILAKPVGYSWEFLLD